MQYFFVSLYVSNAKFSAHKSDDDNKKIKFELPLKKNRDPANHLPSNEIVNLNISDNL
jgi:hypothetical protein